MQDIASALMHHRRDPSTLSGTAATNVHVRRDDAARADPRLPSPPRTDPADVSVALMSVMVTLLLSSAYTSPPSCHRHTRAHSSARVHTAHKPLALHHARARVPCARRHQEGIGAACGATRARHALLGERGGVRGVSYAEGATPEDERRL